MEFKVYEVLPEEAKRIREEVFMKEQGFVEEFDKTDDTAVHIVMYDGEEAVAVCRVYKEKEERDYHIGRLAVVKACRGKKYGEALLKEAERVIAQRGGKSVQLSGQVRVAEFYEKSGYKRQGEEYLDEGCPHVCLVKQLG